MPTLPLPARPNLEQLRKQAKDLLRAVRATEAEALALVAEHHPDHAAATPTFTLDAAHLVIARRHGYASWPRLTRQIDTITRVTNSQVTEFVWTPEHGYHARQNSAPQADIDRCRASASAAHPDPARWQVLISAHHNGIRVIAFATPTGMLFAELTPTTVTLSPPTMVTPPEDRTRLRFHTPLGSMAGTTAPDVHRLGLERPTDRLARASAVVAAGVFLLPNAFPLTPAGLVLRPNHDRTGDLVPAADLPAQAEAVVDRPRPPVDDTAPAARRLRACIAEADCPPAVDPDDWTPGAYLELTDIERLQLGRYGHLLACCRLGLPDRGDQDLLVTDLDPDQTPAPLSAVIGTTITATRIYYDFHERGSNRIAVPGLINDNAVASIVLSSKGKPDVTALISGSTFVLAGPDLTGKDLSRTNRITTRDASGLVLEELPLATLQ